MQECIAFRMQVNNKIPEVMEFVTKKMVEEKMVSYCSEDQTEIEQFGFWCGKYLTVDKANGVVRGFSDVQMYYDYIYTFQAFIKDLAANVPDAEFTGSIEKNNDDFGPEITIEFKMNKGKVEFEKIYFEYFDEDEYEEDEEEEDEDEKYED